MESVLSVTVVIPNYNTWDLVERNISALLQFDEAWITEIIVVDDCSPTPNPLVFPNKVQVLRNTENLHYTRTVNRGLRAAKGDVVVLLDSDAYPVQPFIQALVETYYRQPNLGCIGFKTVDEQGRDSGNWMTEPSIWSLVAGQQLHQYLAPYNIFRSKHVLPFSCAVSFRKACLEEMGYLDEHFRVLDADNDLSMRIYRSNWLLQYNPDFVICHTGGNSIPRDGKRVILFYESRWQLLQKHKKIKAPAFFAYLIRLRLWVETKIIQYHKKKWGPLFENKLNTRKYLVEYFKGVMSKK
jgi:GT2 family glycosyltransferase